MEIFLKKLYLAKKLTGEGSETLVWRFWTLGFKTSQDLHTFSTDDKLYKKLYKRLEYFIIS